MVITKPFSNWLSRLRSSRLAFSTIQSIAAGFGGQLLLLISGPLIARLLGVDGRGYLAAINVWGLTLTAVGTMGIPTACAYYLNQEGQDQSRTLGETYRIAFMQIVVIVPIFGAVLTWWACGKPADVQIGAYLSLAFVPANLLHQYALGVIQGQRRFAALNITRSLPALFYAIGAVGLFIGEERRFPYVVSMWVASFSISAALSTLIALKGRKIIWLRDRSLKRELLTFGVRGHIGNLAPVDNLRLDQAAAAFFLSVGSLGMYAVAATFSNLPRFIAQSAGLVAYPSIARLNGGISAAKLVWWYFLGISAMNVAVALLLILTMPLLIPWLFGTEFSDAIQIAQILVVGGALAGSRKILVECLRGTGYPGASTLAELSMYPWLITGALYLMLTNGALGLAIGVTFGYGLSLSVAIAVWYRHATSRKDND